MRKYFINDKEVSQKIANDYLRIKLEYGDSKFFESTGIKIKEIR